MASGANLTLRAALSDYFAANGLPADGGYEKRWVVIRVGQLELRVLGFVLARWPGALFQAFRRERQSGNLLDQPVDDALRARSVGELQRELGIDPAPAPPSDAERRAFARWAALAVAIVWGPLVPIGILLWWWIG